MFLLIFTYMLHLRSYYLFITILIQETPIPGSYKIPDNFMGDLSKRPNSYRFRSDGRRLDPMPHIGRGQYLMPGAYSHKSMVEEYVLIAVYNVLSYTDHCKDLRDINQVTCVQLLNNRSIFFLVFSCSIPFDTKNIPRLFQLPCMILILIAYNCLLLYFKTKLVQLLSCRLSKRLGTYTFKDTGRDSKDILNFGKKDKVVNVIIQYASC